MEKLSKSFFGNEVLIWGCTPPDKVYYTRLYKAFTQNGITVYPMSIMPKDAKTTLDFKTFDTLEEVSKIPECVYVLANKDTTHPTLKRFRDAGVKRIVFYSKACVSPEDLAECEKMGIETRLGCPMMLYGKGPCRLHAFLAGIKRK